MERSDIGKVVFQGKSGQFEEIRLILLEPVMGAFRFGGFCVFSGPNRRFLTSLERSDIAKAVFRTKNAQFEKNRLILLI